MTTKLEPEREKEARDFLEQTLGRKIEGEFGDALKDGIVLCECVHLWQSQ